METLNRMHSRTDGRGARDERWDRNRTRTGLLPIRYPCKFHQLNCFEQALILRTLSLSGSI